MLNNRLSLRLYPSSFTIVLIVTHVVDCVRRNTKRTMAFWILSLIHSALERVVHSLFSGLLYLSLAVALGHYFGWIERWIWCILEKEARKIVNGAKITMGSFRLDWSSILQGKIIAEVSNVVLHTPQRHLWGWESPLIARVGKAKVEVNAPVTIIHEIFFRMKLPLEIYSVYVADVQVFVERHDQVINVYLCDPAAVLPTPPYLNVQSPASQTSEKRKGSVDWTKSKSSDGEPDVDTVHVDDEDKIVSSDSASSTEGEQKHKEQAEKLVKDMLHAVQSLGRAAQTGSLHTAVRQHGIEIAEILRDGLSTRHRNTSELEQGVALMEQVGKVAVESLKTPKLILPQRNVKPGGPQPPMARVGRILLKDIRVFTKDSWIQMSQDSKNNSKATKYIEDTGAFGGVEDDEDGFMLKKGKWNKPIFIESLVVRASELCPPMSMKDQEDVELPAMYQRIDKIIEIVWRRLLAEMAKSNGGRLFSTALGEVLSFIQSNPQQAQRNSRSTGTTPKGSTATILPKVSSLSANGSLLKSPRGEDIPELPRKSTVTATSPAEELLGEVTV